MIRLRLGFAASKGAGGHARSKETQGPPAAHHGRDVLGEREHSDERSSLRLSRAAGSRLKTGTRTARPSVIGSWFR
jgi:hypothetical protein